MGQVCTILKNCCCGRDDEFRTKAQEASSKKTEDDDRLYLEALTTNDLTTLASLLDSRRSCQPHEWSHPWAAKPQSVGTLAATQLAALAAMDDALHWRTAIRECGAIPQLIKMAKSPEDDRVHAAVLSLSFLSVDSVENCATMVESDGMKVLVDVLRSTKVTGLQATSAMTLRNIYVCDMLYRQEFAACGGIPPLVALLDLPAKFDPINLHLQSEAVRHLEDFILDGGVEMPHFVAMLKATAANKKLEILSKVDGNTELSQTANRVLVRLED